MRQLLVEEGDSVRVALVDLPRGTYVKLRAEEAKFLEISNPKAV